MHELIERRNAILASVERLAFDRVVSRKRTLLNLNSKGDKVNYIRFADDFIVTAKSPEILKEKGYPIARRTIAKYREQMDIPVARMRKKI